MNGQAPIVLASRSPRRRRLLEGLGIAFRVIPSEVEEARKSAEAPVPFAKRAALEKGEEVCARLGGQGDLPWIVSADTIVVIDGDVLFKPRDEADAGAMMRRLSGRTHTVVTGWALGRSGVTWHVDHAETSVTFHALSEEEIERYVATREGMDKAGAYAIQGIGAFLVDRIEGNYFNVVGLPVSRVARALVRVGALPYFPLS
jgi:septum formation protein